MGNDVWQLFAVKYAHHHRMSSENFLGGDSHEVPMPLDYFSSPRVQALTRMLRVMRGVIARISMRAMLLVER